MIWACSARAEPARARPCGEALRVVGRGGKLGGVRARAGRAGLVDDAGEQRVFGGGDAGLLLAVEPVVQGVEALARVGDAAPLRGGGEPL